VKLRPARPGDIDQLLALEQACFGDEAWPRGGIEAELTSPGRSYLVLQAGDRLLAYGGIATGPDFAEVMTVAVHPEFQGQGWGRRLMEHLISAAAQAGTDQVLLEVADNNSVAISLYQSMGFAAIGSRPRYYQPSDRDALVMRLDLAEPGS